MSQFIPYGRHSLSDTDINAALDVLRSDFITQGPQVPGFENALASYTGANHAVVVNSATSALHIACLALGVGPGDIVWTTPNTFVASANCALYCGAKVDFVDIDPDSYNMSVEQLKNKLERAREQSCLPKVVIPVHFSGQSCDMSQIRELSNEFGFFVIEDASHAIGGKYRDTLVGSCHYSDITVFSFHPVKIITTGEGGAALTNDDALAEKMYLLRSHGVTRSPKKLINQDGPWFYEQHVLGFNYRMTDIQAALGTQQLKRVDELVEMRRLRADMYIEMLSGASCKLPTISEDCLSAHHLFVVQVEKRDEVYARMQEAKIGVNVHYIPVHLQPFYRSLGFERGYCPVAEEYYRKALTLPLFPDLTIEDQERVCRLL